MSKEAVKDQTTEFEKLLRSLSLTFLRHELEETRNLALETLKESCTPETLDAFWLTLIEAVSYTHLTLPTKA